MLPPDLALAQLVNRTAVAYTQRAPLFMSFRERTHVTVPSFGRSQNIDRTEKVRVGDDYAVMQDLPNGTARRGQAFPIIPYFDPFSAFDFGYYANLKRVDITLKRGAPVYFTMPAPDPGVTAVVPYNSFWIPTYAPDSSDARAHLLIEPTARVGTGFYPSEIIEDAGTQLPARVVMRTPGDDEVITLDFIVLENHWVISHGIFTATERTGPLKFEVIAEVIYDQYLFSAAAPDALLQGK